jgi:hypothetical protein
VGVLILLLFAGIGLQLLTPQIISRFHRCRAGRRGA